MEEIINKPDNQFKDILNDLIDYSKDSEEKKALINEVCLTKRTSKPAASLNSSIYSSAASSSSSTSSASESSTSSAPSSSANSTLSSPSQSNQVNSEVDLKKCSANHDRGLPNLEVAKMEDLGKTARILEHRLAISNDFRSTPTNGAGYTVVSSSHSDNIRSTNLFNDSAPQISPPLSQILIHPFVTQQMNPTHLNSTVNSNTTTEIWKTKNGKNIKRPKRPSEQPVLSQHIPGHKGEQELDELVRYIESAGSNNLSSLNQKKVSKTSKQQPKRQQSQTMESERENHQRKSNNKPTSTQNGSAQHQPKQLTNSNTTVTSTQMQHSNQRKVQTLSVDNQQLSTLSQHQQSSKQQSFQEQSNDRGKECKETNGKLRVKQNHDIKSEEKDQTEPVVTFAEHIRISDEDFGSRYTFGFFEEQRQNTNNQLKQMKTTKQIENSTVINAKSNQVGQKHKLKHPKTSLISEQKRYKYNDNIDVNSFNYQQILEFISSSWENTSKSHRLIVKHTTVGRMNGQVD